MLHEALAIGHRLDLQAVKADACVGPFASGQIAAGVFLGKLAVLARLIEPGTIVHRNRAVPAEHPIVVNQRVGLTFQELFGQLDREAFRRLKRRAHEFRRFRLFPSGTGRSYRRPMARTLHPAWAHGPEQLDR